MERLGDPVQFTGQLSLPDDPDTRLKVILTMSPERVRVTEGSVELGSWSSDQVTVAEVDRDRFSLVVDGDRTLFLPDDPVGFKHHGSSLRHPDEPTAAGPMAKLKAWLTGPNGATRETQAAAEPTPNEPEPRPAPLPPAPSAGSVVVPPAVESVSVPPTPPAPPQPVESPVDVVHVRVGDPVPFPWASRPSSPQAPPVKAPPGASSRCLGRRKDGLPCRAQIVGSSGFCSVHDPDVTKARHTLRSPGISGAFRPLLRKLDGLIEQVESGEVEPETALAVASLVRAVVDLVDLEQRRSGPGPDG